MSFIRMFKFSFNSTIIEGLINLFFFLFLDKSSDIKNNKKKMLMNPWYYCIHPFFQSRASESALDVQTFIAFVIKFFGKILNTVFSHV